MTAVWHLTDTIAALASPPGPAPRGIIRVSGPAALAVLRDWFIPLEPTAPPSPPLTPPGPPAPTSLSAVTPSPASGPSGSLATDPAGSGSATPWYARTRPWRTPGSLRLAELYDPLEVDLYCWPTRRSYTGQPMVELHTLGSPVLLDQLLQELFARGVRAARPGEFTLRAFLAGRIDLTQAEAVLGVIDADTPAELHSALRQLAGGVSREFDRLRHNLLDLLADLEAGLDFADEEIEFITPAQLTARLTAAHQTLTEVAGQARDRHRESARWRVVLAGPPNAGKSTLFNALARRTAALVSPEAGTTRDWLEVEIELVGVPVLLIDTAGQEEAVDEVSRLSQARQAEQVARADLLLWCQPVGTPHPPPTEVPGSPEVLRVWTKADLTDAELPKAGTAASAEAAGIDAVMVSARQPETVRQLGEQIARRLKRDTAGRSWLVGTTAARAADSLRGARQALERAIDLARREVDQDLLAVEVREALAELGKITGAVYTDDILDRIFSKFCIGK